MLYSKIVIEEKKLAEQYLPGSYILALFVNEEVKLI